MHALAEASSVSSVVRVTGNFSSENPLSPAARAALLAAFDQGWSDPKKLSQSAGRAAILRNSALENIASQLGLRPDSIEVLGEPSLGHFLSISGLLGSQSTFVYASVDKGKIRAIARSHSGPVVELPVDAAGNILGRDELPAASVLSLQLANGETGIIQDGDQLSRNIDLIAIDATASGSRIALPEKWSTALFDSTSWNGPAGLAIMAIKESSEYSYPLPHIAPIRAPGSYSLPLLIASAVALEEFEKEDGALRKFAIREFSDISGLEVVAPNSPSLPHIFSLLVSEVSGENLVRELARLNFDLDSGSACSPDDLQPSHVLAAMGYETNGHLRITLQSGVTEEEIITLAKAVTGVADTLRS